MNIRALRQDLAQKSAEARKTHLSEDKINTTFSGLYDEASTEKYRELAEALEIQLNDLVDTINETHKMRLSSAKNRGKIVEAGEKKAKKDYDGDGVIETGEEEWKGSRDNAIKRAIAQNEVSEGTMSKALRLGHKYPARVAQAQAVQGRRADAAETLRSDMHKEAEKMFRQSMDLGRKAEKAANAGSIYKAELATIFSDAAEKAGAIAQSERDAAAATEQFHISNIDKLVKKALKNSRKKKK